MSFIIYCIVVVAYLLYVGGFPNQHLFNINGHRVQRTPVTFPYSAQNNYNIYNDVTPYNERELYTIIWEDCNECRELIHHMEHLGLKYICIDNCYTMGIDDYMFDQIEKPQFYKNDKFIGNKLFDILAVIYEL